MQTTMIRTNGLDLVNSARKALAAQKAQKDQKAQDRNIRTFCANLNILGLSPIADVRDDVDVLAELHKMVETAEKGHNAAVRALGHFMDNSANSAVYAYNVQKVLFGIFGHKCPTFTTWLNTGK